MRIAFDLDGLLIPAPGSVMAVQRVGLLARALSHERIRAGAPDLLATLRRHGHEIWIYTTSFRSPWRLRIWFASFGARLDGVVTQVQHRAAMAGREMSCSKYPPAFGIDLLIDDAEGVELEGGRLGFAVLRIKEDDADWCSRVLSAVAGRTVRS